jgi:magnesium-transporting ATPase (P-type)
LKEADIGIAMHGGTAVAKQAAQIILMDDNFASVVKSLMWGRCVYDNVRKFVQFQLTIIMVAILLSIIGAFSLYSRPLTAVQLLWMNLIMDTFCALSLCTDTPTDRLLQRRPYVKSAHVISPLMLRNIVCHTAFQLAALLLVLYLGHRIWDLEAKSKHHYTLVFNAYVFLQLFNEVNMRQVTSRDRNVFHNLTQNVSFWLSKAICAILQFLMVEYFGAFGRTHPLNWEQWLFCVGIGSLELVFGAFVRLIPVDDETGLVVSPPTDAFKGANLDLVDPVSERSAVAVESVSIELHTVTTARRGRQSVAMEPETLM